MKTSNQSIRTGRVFVRARPSMPFASCGHARACRLNNSSSSWIIPHSSLNLDSSEPVLVHIVSIRNLERQGAIAIAFQTAAKIDGVVNPANLIITADAQRYCVILAV